MSKTTDNTETYIATGPWAVAKLKYFEKQKQDNGNDKGRPE
jgi:hypothetical protein